MAIVFLALVCRPHWPPFSFSLISLISLIDLPPLPQWFFFFFNSPSLRYPFSLLFFSVVLPHVSFPHHVSTPPFLSFHILPFTYFSSPYCFFICASSSTCPFRNIFHFLQYFLLHFFSSMVPPFTYFLIMILPVPPSLWSFFFILFGIPPSVSFLNYFIFHCSSCCLLYYFLV